MSKNAALKITLISALAAIIGGAVVAGIEYWRESSARTEGGVSKLGGSNG